MAGSADAIQADRLTVIFEGIEIILSSNKTQLPADGISTASISSLVRTVTRKINVPEASLRFSAEEGQITSNATTDENGRAQVTFTAAITTSADDIITTRLGNTLSSQLTQKYVQPVLSISSDLATLPADNISTTTVRARLLTPGGIPIEGATVDFSLSGPGDVSILVQGATGENGEAIATVKAGQTPGTATINASFSDLSVSTSIDVLGLNVTLTTSKTSMLADGESTAEIILVVKTQNTNVAVVGKTVIFATDLGTIQAITTTNSAGVATANLTSSSSAGTATVTATIGSISRSVSVDMVAVGTNLAVSSSESSILRDGESTSVITVTVTNNEGNSLPGNTVTWNVSSGTGTLGSSSSITDDQGQASVTYRADAADSLDGNGVVQATVDGNAQSTTIQLRGISLRISSDKTQIADNGTDAVTISLEAKETSSGNPVIGKSVKYATTLGRVTASAITNTIGIATGTLTSADAGTATVTATLGNNRVAAIDISVSVLVSVSASESSILRDGTSTSTVTATIVNGAGDAVEGETVTWSVTSGTGSVSPTSAVTDENGQATATFTSDAAFGSDGSATIQAAASGGSGSTSITLRGVTLDLTASKSVILDDGVDASTITLTATETTSGAPLPGKTVTFSTNLGTVTSSAITNNDGQATTTLVSASSGTATVTVGLGSRSETVDVLVSSRSLFVILSADSTSILRDGETTLTLTATVTDGGGLLLSGKTISWRISSGSGTVIGSSDTTDTNGEATAVFTPDAADSTDSSAIIQAAVSGSSDQFQIELRGISLSISTDRSTIVADGTDTAQITLTAVETSSGDPVVGRSITFSTDLGSVTSPANTDNNGQATSSLTSTTSGVATVTATLGSARAASIQIAANAFSVTSSTSSIHRDGVSTATVTATYRDDGGNAVSGQSVSWSILSGTGSLSATNGTTGTNGQTSVIFTADAADSIDVSTVIRAMANSGSASVTITLRGISLGMSSDKSALIADGSDAATITLQAVETSSGNPVVGKTVSFSTNLGTVTASSTTDSDGKTTATLKSGSTGTATVTATLGNSRTAAVDVAVNAQAITVSASASSTSILRDGESTSTVTATVTDNNGDPLSGQTVTWSRSAGTGSVSPVTATTDVNGQATTTFTADAADSTDGSGTVQASAGGNTDTSTITLRGISLSMSSDVSAIITDGGDAATITLQAVETSTGNPVVGKTVSFSTNLGTVSASSTTDSDGKVTATLKSGSTGTATVTATLGNSRTAAVDVAVNAQAITVSVSASSTSILRDGESTSTVTATVTDNNGDPLSGQTVTWSRSAGTGSVSPATAITDVNGQATTTFTADAADSLNGSGTVQASAGGNTDTSTITLRGISLSISSDVSAIIADDSDAATITLQAVETSTGNTVVGKTVSFATNLGTVSVSSTTDSDGKATATLKSGSTGTATVTATLGNSRTAAVDVTVNAQAIAVSASASSTSILRDGESTSTVTATVTDNNDDPLSGQTVAWSLVGATPSGVTLSGSSSETSSAGKATVSLTSDAAATNATASLRVTVSGVSDTVNITLEGLVLTLTSEKTSIPANGTSTTQISLVAKSQATNAAVVGKNVVFSTNLGTIPAAGTTDEAGVAKATLTGSTSAGTATVTARIGDISATTQVMFAATANVTVELSADNESLLRDGSDGTEIRATVVDGDGTPLADRVVDFTLIGSGSLSSSQPQQTNTSGVASLVLTTDAAISDTTARIIASSEGQKDTLDISLLGISMVMTASPTAIVADGDNTSSISLLLKETTTNAGIPNRTIQFATTLGTITATSTTNGSGVASVNLTAGTTSGTATITATLGTVSTTTTVDFLAKALNLNLSAVSGAILRDGIAFTDLTVTVQDPNGNDLSELDVTWSVLGGGSVFPTTGQTGSSGTHSTRLTADAGGTDATATVTVTVGDSTTATDITLKGVSLTSSVQPDTILANESEATFTWQAFETTSGAVIANHVIVIAKTSGPSVLLSNVSTETNSSGSASATVTSTTNAGDLKLQATLGGVARTDSLHLLQDQFTVDLSPSGATLLRDGEESVTLTATVTDRFNDPVTDQRVDFALTGVGSLSKNFISTNSNGEAQVTLTSDINSSNSSAQIVASVSTAADTSIVQLYGVTLSIKATPTSLIADNESKSTIEVTVKEAGSNTPLIGRTVSFAVTPGTFATITAQATTDSRGIASATLTADTSASFTATVTGRLGTDPSTTLTASTTVDIVAAVYNISTSASPSSILRDGENTSAVTVTVTNNYGDPYSGRVVTWSRSAGTGSVNPTIVITDADGQATTTFTADAADSLDGSGTVQAVVVDSTVTTTITLRGISLSISSDVSAIIADGSDAAAITLQAVETTSGNPVEGKTISFSTNLGTVSASSTTDSDGKATATLKSDSTGTATVSATLGNSRTAAVDVAVNAQALTVSLAAADTTMLRDGVSSTTVTVTVTDNDGDPVADKSVDWGLSGAGVLSDTTQTTDSNGEATATFTSDAAATADVTATVQVTVGGNSDTRTIELRGITLTVATNKDTIIADDSDEATITATVVETTTHNPLVGKTVNFTSDVVGSTIAASATTDAEGKATATLKGTSAGDATITAKFNDSLTDNVAVRLDAQALTVSLAAADTTMLRDGVSSTTVTVTVTDNDGDPVADKSVDWGLSGAGALSDTTQTTDSSGQATATFTSDAAATADITGTVQVTIEGNSDTRDIDLRGITLTVATNKDTIVADDIDWAAITATVIETTRRNPLVGKTVNFTSDVGTIAASATTNSEGKATATLKGTSAGDATVTAKFNDTLTDNVSVRLDALSLTVSLAAVDTTMLRDGVSSTTVTVTVTDNDGDPVADKSVDWGLSGGGALSDTTQTTDSSGQATATFTSDAAATADVTATVQVTVEGTSNTRTIDLRGITLTVDASPDTISAGGTNTSTITASLVETTNNVAVSGKEIDFTTNLGSLPDSVKTTDSSGGAEISLSPGTTSGTATVTASYGALSENVSVEIISGGVANLLPFTTKTEVAADSLVTWDISVVATDSLANPVSGIEIRWSASPDTLGSIVSLTTTNVNGVATTTLVYHERYGGENITITARSGDAIRTETLILPIP